MLSRDLFDFLERCAPWLVLWSFVFTCITTIRIARRMARGVHKVPDSAVYTELAGLPLTLLQSVCCAWAVWAGDWLSMLLFVWWGPGFFAVAFLVVAAKLRKQSINWHLWFGGVGDQSHSRGLARVLEFAAHHEARHASF